MDSRKNVLFVCTANMQRSPTAETLYQDDPRFEVRSAGTHALATQPVTEELLNWADLVVAMEDRHAQEIKRRFAGRTAVVRVIVLGIPDVYEYMDRRLQIEIRERFEAQL